jgi:hypothetical protein
VAKAVGLELNNDDLLMGKSGQTGYGILAME